MKMTKDHVFSSIEEGQAARELVAGAVLQRCGKHKEETLSLFCLKCDLRLCSACVASAHEGHEVKGIEEVAKGCREMLKTGLEQLK